jgi:flagellar M-ring protein FliF
LGEFIGKIIKQIGDFFSALSPAKRVALGVTAFGVVIGISLMFRWAGSQTYQPLMTNLGAEDSANIIRILREKRIPFKVDESGKNISIPPESVHDLRLELATMGLPQSSVVGYEVFDKQALGTTSFTQKVNQKRALEGELMRTIKQIKGVRNSRVHLALPQKSTFVEDQKKATASVVLDLEPGMPLSEKQVFGIGNLVARAVEGLDINDVVIVDATGKTLSKNTSDPIATATATQLDFKTRLEQDVEKRIEAMLSRVVGEGKVVARVNADLDFSQVAETQTLYDQDGSAIRSVQKDTKAMEGSRPGPVGLAGVQSNQPGATPTQNAQIRSDTKTNNEVINYEVPSTVRRTQKTPGSVKRLSVAVVVDGKTVKSAGKDGVVQSKVEAWSPDKLKEFEDIIAQAAGIDRKRGDTIEVKNMEFSREDFEEASKVIAEQERRSYIQQLVLHGAIGLVILAFMLIVVRPFVKWLTENTVDSVDSFLPQTIEELERLQKSAILPGMEETVPELPEQVDPEKVEGEMIKEKIITLVDSNPHKAALILRDWLHVGEGKKEGEEGGKPEKSA